MGRPEKPLSTADGPIAQIASDLRQMRAAADLTYRDMGEKAHYSHTSLSRAAKGERLPTWETTQAFVRACGATDEEVHEWRRRWVSARAQLKSSTDESATDVSCDAAVTSPTIADYGLNPSENAVTGAVPIARKIVVALVTSVLFLASLMMASTLIVSPSPTEELPAASGHDWGGGGGGTPIVNSHDPATEPGLLMLAELDPEAGRWDDEQTTSGVSRQAAKVTACSPPRGVRYILPPRVTRVSFKVELGAYTSPGPAVTVKITVDDTAVFSQLIQANISYAVDAGSLTEPQRLTIEWGPVSGNNGTGNNCEPHGRLMLSDARLYR